jgi:hypothetical protein
MSTEMPTGAGFPILTALSSDVSVMRRRTVPEAVPPRDEGAPPWWPGTLRGAVRSAGKLLDDWQYVVVEEVVGSTVELMRWPWPRADSRGRLFWPTDAEEQVMTAAVPQRLVRLQLYRPNALLRRPRAGDTFAARISSAAPGWAGDRQVDDLADLFPGPVYDVSADAREAAKLAYQGASSAVFDGSQYAGVLAEALEQREQRPKARRLKVIPLDEVIDDEGDAR